MGSWERLRDYADLPADEQVDFFIHLPTARVAGGYIIGIVNQVFLTLPVTR